MLDVNKLAEAVVGGAKAYVDRQLSGIVERLTSLESRQPERGEKGEPGEAGNDGTPGKDGAPGTDGVGIADALIGKDGDLVVTLSNGAAKSLGVVVGKDGQPGKDGADGRDGLGFDDLELIHDGQKGFTFRWSRGDRVVERSFTIPVATYRGTFKSGESYSPGDMVTWGGSMWHCDTATDAKPDAVGQKDWTLAVKRGQNGKDAQ